MKTHHGVQTITGGDDLKRWPARMTLVSPLLGLVVPVRVARRLDHVSIAAAWLAHLAGLMIVAVIGLVLGRWLSGYEDHTLLEVILLLPKHIVEVVHGFFDRTYLMFKAVAVIGCELTFIVGAWLLVSWGARPEPWRTSYRRTLVRIWLSTSHLGVYVVCFWVPLTYLDRWLRFGHWWSTNQDMVYALVGLCVMMSGFAVALWVVRAGGWRAHCRWPAQCEGCGYLLLGLAPERTCPECGLALSQTLDPASRPGIGFESEDSPASGPRAQAGQNVGWMKHWLGGYVRLNTQAIVRPVTLGRRMHLLTPVHLGRRFLPLTLLLLLGATVGFYIGGYWVAWRYGALGDKHQGYGDLLFALLMMLCVVWPIAIGMTLLGASFSGAMARQLAGRNLLPIARQASACLGGYLVLGAVVMMGYSLVAATVALEAGPTVTRITILGDLTLDELLDVFFAVLCACLLVGYLILAGRITWAGRYANR